MCTRPRKQCYMLFLRKRRFNPGSSGLKNGPYDSSRGPELRCNIHVSERIKKLILIINSTALYD